MSDPEELIRRFVGAYGPYVRRRTAELGLPSPDALEPAIEAGSEWLHTALSDLMAQPFEAQTRGPLELFQEAMRFPTEALLAAGITPLGRDPVETRALPGDRFRLAPVSSRDLGEDAWRIHLAWGMAKADSMKGRR